jgi:hypothetical protein
VATASDCPGASELLFASCKAVNASPAVNRLRLINTSPGTSCAALLACWVPGVEFKPAAAAVAAAAALLELTLVTAAAAVV